MLRFEWFQRILQVLTSDLFCVLQLFWKKGVLLHCYTQKKAIGVASHKHQRDVTALLQNEILISYQMAQSSILGV